MPVRFSDKFGALGQYCCDHGRHTHHTANSSQSAFFDQARRGPASSSLPQLDKKHPLQRCSRPPQDISAMSYITSKDGTQIYYKDWGDGPVVTFSHGWPLNSDAWDGQMLFLAQHGYRV